MRLVYFAWVREQVGLAEEEVTLPNEVRTIADLFTWLSSRGDSYAVFKQADQLRAAINQEHVNHNTSLKDAIEIALFPPMTGG